jgi:2-hydroxychromene-2-carboxylate isomerase
MSWTVNAIGKSPAVRAAVAKQFADGSKCAEPEESIRLATAALIDQSLAAQTESSAVKVAASGSMSKSQSVGKPETISNSLIVEVTPQWGFVE